MNILLVDDERPARDRLRALLTEHNAGHRIREADNGASALHQVAAEMPEAVLLDVRMPGMDGLETALHLSQLESPPAVIFITAYEEHALAAFEASAVDYLLKPIRRVRLYQALERVHTLQRGTLQRLWTHPGVYTSRRHISTIQAGSIRLATVSEIRFFKAEQKYVVARWPEGQLLTEESLHLLEQEFAADFLRVHRNALAALRHIRALVPTPEGGSVLQMDGVPEMLQISRRLLPVVRRQLRRRPAREPPPTSR